MKLLAAAFVTAVLAIVASAPAFAQATPAQIAVSPAAPTLAIGQSGAIDVTVANIASAPGLGGYDVSLAFDPAVVRIESLTDAGIFSGDANIVICTPAQIDQSVGKATINCTPVPIFSSPGPSTTPPVALLHASFSALAPGTSPLDLAGSTLQDPSGATLPSTLVSGSITVTSAAPTVASTATRVPQTATPQPSTAAIPSETAQAATTMPPASPSASATRPAGALRAPSTGTGAGTGSSRFRWIVAAMAVAAAVGAAGATAMQVRRARRT